MNTLLAAFAGLIVLSGAFYLFPRRSEVDDDLQQANVEWFLLREKELLAEGNTAEIEKLREDARLRLLEDDGKIEQPAGSGTGGFPVWLLLPFVAIVSGALYYKLGAASDVLIYRDMQAAGENVTQEERARLIGAMQARSDQRPDNLHYQALLGRYYMSVENYALAARSYGRLADATEGDAQVLAYAAQSEYLAADRKLSDNARLRAEQALAVDPHQRTALGLLGMASFEQAQYRAAIEYWERLLAIEVPGSEGASMIAGVIARARELAGVPPVDSSGVAEALPAGTGITVEVRLPDGANIAATATVFVLARAANSNSRMPIAVQRLNAASFPLTVRLSDTNSMAGQKLSESGEVIVAVQVSPDGRPGADNASWLAESAPLKASNSKEPLVVLLQPQGS